MPEKIRVDDVVVLLPGILGSVLGRDGHDLWAISPDAIFHALLSHGESLEGLAFESPAEGHRDPAPGGLVATRLFRDVHLIPNLWKIDGYGRIDEVLQEHLELDRSENYFDFPYDWRLDNRIAARRLKQSTDEWLERRRQARGKHVRLILIAHSMGGLVARYFLEVLDGWKDTRMLITFGTPYHGSLNALDYLVNGYSVGMGSIARFDLSKLVRSFPSIYQLLPMYRAIHLDGGPLKRIGEVADRIPNTEVEEIRDAVAFHEEIASAVRTHRKLAKYRQSGYERHPVVGAEQPTAVLATIGAGGGATLGYSYPDVTWTGDSTVPWISAHPRDDPKGVLEAGIYRPERHGSLQNSEDVLMEVRNLIARLLPGSAIERRAAPNTISLQLSDWNERGEIPIVARCDAGPLYVNVIDVAGELPAAERIPLAARHGVHRGTITGLATGTYRVTVTATDGIGSVTDICMVVGG